jgi:hypothetical protein
LNDYDGEAKDNMTVKDYPTPKTITTASKLVLPKSIYGLETDAKKTPFGMLNEQIRADGVLNNAGWFNLAGEKIGHGDISMKDMEKISNNLNANECFFVLLEFDTTWGMPKDMNANEPGKDYVLKHCVWSISRSSILKVRDTTTAVKTENAKSSDGVEYTKVGRTAFEKVITTLFYAKAASTTKHVLPADAKTEGIDALIKSTLTMGQKLTATKPAPKAAVGQRGLPSPISTAKPAATTPSPVAVTKTPVKAKLATP